MARIERREVDAERLYEQVIGSARANGFIHNEALAYELAARFYAARGFKQIADLYLRNARYGYLRWGAAERCGNSTRRIQTSDRKSHFPARRAPLVRRLNTSTSGR